MKLSPKIEARFTLSFKFSIRFRLCVLVNVFDILFDKACSAACNCLFAICPLTFSFYILYQDLPRISRQGEGANEEVDDAIPDINAIAQSGERCVGKKKCL